MCLLLNTYKTQSYFSLGLKLFQDLYDFLTAHASFTLLSQHFPYPSSVHKKKEGLENDKTNWRFTGVTRPERKYHMTNWRLVQRILPNTVHHN